MSVTVTQAAMSLAEQICGCATPEQRKSDVAALLAYREQAVRDTEAQIVAWLRSCLIEEYGPTVAAEQETWWFAAVIEQGAHKP